MNFELKKLVLDSREVAKMLGKDHTHIEEQNVVIIQFFRSSKQKPL